MRKHAMLLFALLLALSGCGSPNNAVDERGNNEVRSEAPAESSTADSSASTVKDVPTAEQPATDEAPKTADPQEGDGTPAAPDLEAEQPAVVKTQYRMNAAYRFEPITDDAPAKVVLLTFDDGPKELDMLTSMLDTLDRHEAKAVFFINGYRAVKQPELLKLIVDRGHMIGNHSWDHIDLKKEDEATVAKQLGDVQQLVFKEVGVKPTMFRPPFGSGGDAVREAAAREGMLYMTWSNGSLDWDASTKDKPEKVIANVLEQLHPGANILMHELPWTDEALDGLLTSLKDKGYGFINPAAIEVPKPSEG